MARSVKWVGWILGGLALAIGAPLALLAHPEPAFAYHLTAGRLALYSDRPFDTGAGRRVLADIESRLAASPIDDHAPHAIFIANSAWRETLFFNRASGAAGLNYYPLSNDVFLRRSSVELNRVYGRSGRPAAAPRTLAYYGAHEIAHSFTAERAGPAHLWNFEMPQWVREGYADYVGMGGHVDIDDLWRRYKSGDPELDYRRSGVYARFRMLAAYLIQRRGWSVDRLLASKLTEEQALKMMSADMSGSNEARSPSTGSTSQHNF